MELLTGMFWPISSYWPEHVCLEHKPTWGVGANYTFVLISIVRHASQAQNASAQRPGQPAPTDISEGFWPITSC